MTWLKVLSKMYWKVWFVNVKTDLDAFQMLNIELMQTKRSFIPHHNLKFESNNFPLARPGVGPLTVKCRLGMWSLRRSALLIVDLHDQQTLGRHPRDWIQSTNGTSWHWRDSTTKKSNLGPFYFLLLNIFYIILRNL